MVFEFHVNCIEIMIFEFHENCIEW